MIRGINRNDIPKCARIIKDSFLTVADAFGITRENAPRFTAFAVSDEKLLSQFEDAQRLMRVYQLDNGGDIIGYYALRFQQQLICELDNLCVLPEFRHRGVGTELLTDACNCAKEKGCSKIMLSIIEENDVLRKWYETQGFSHTDTKTFAFFPFTCGYLEKSLL